MPGAPQLAVGSVPITKQTRSPATPSSPTTNTDSSSHPPIREPESSLPTLHSSLITPPVPRPLPNKPIPPQLIATKHIERR